MNTIRKSLPGRLLDLVYPPLCMGCGQPLPVKLEILCVSCLAHLSPLDIGDYEDNAMVRHFWGRCPIEYSIALFGYYPGGRIQRIIRQIKYNNQKRLARLMGQWLGRLLASSPLFLDVDSILPVPLHPLKLESRGYNQSDLIGHGVAEVLGCSLSRDQLIRTKQSASQTTLNRIDRCHNMQEAFEFQSDLKGHRHLLLLDDVVTTGATLEACAIAIREKTGARISAAALALGGA